VTDWLHLLIERYGLIAVFVGCLAEGESAATLAGFFAHQGLFAPATAFATVFSGAFLGDSAAYLVGGRTIGFKRLEKLRASPNFIHAAEFVRRNPAKAILLMRYIYGLRTVGGIAAGVPLGRFLALNGLSSLIWTAIFCGVGCAFGLTLQTVVAAELARHERLFAALAVAILVTGAVWLASRRLRRDAQ
jgi:membrane protein DedA with SNARE-associated domain